MKKIKILLQISLLLTIGASAQTKQIEKLQTVQDYRYEHKNWIKAGKPHTRPDTLTLVHAYQWKKDQIVAVQDFVKVNNTWVKSGEVYPAPDTLTLIHALVKR